MISKLKEACGFEYTNKLQRMFQDMQISKDLNSNFKEFETNLQDDESTAMVDASYSILGTGFWPLVPPNTDFSPPPEIVKAYERFQKFYNQKHSGRKLTWLWQLCKGEMRANYCKASKVPYTFQVSTYQMAILLLFNEKDINTYEDISKATQLAADSLDPSLAIFVKAKVLIQSPEGPSYKPETTFKLNYDFKHKKIRVNLNIAVKSEQKQEVDDTHKTIEEDRKLLMQVSCLVSELIRNVTNSISIVCYRPYHEGSQEDEAHQPRQRVYQPNSISLHAQDPRYQEMHRYPVGEGISRTPR